MTIVAYLKIPKWFYDCRWSISNRSDQIAGEQAKPPLAFSCFFQILESEALMYIYIYIQISWHETNVRECRYSVYIYIYLHTHMYLSSIGVKVKPRCYFSTKNSWIWLFQLPALVGRLEGSWAIVVQSRGSLMVAIGWPLDALFWRW